MLARLFNKFTITWKLLFTGESISYLQHIERSQILSTPRYSIPVIDHTPTQNPFLSFPFLSIPNVKILYCMKNIRFHVGVKNRCVAAGKSFKSYSSPMPRGDAEYRSSYHHLPSLEDKANTCLIARQRSPNHASQPIASHYRSQVVGY